MSIHVDFFDKIYINNYNSFYYIWCEEMKRKIIFLLILCMSFTFIGCKNNETEKEEASAPVVNELDGEAANVDRENTDADGESPGSVYDPCLDYGLPIPTKTHTSDNGSKLILVNKQYAVSSDFYPSDMVAVDGSLSTNQGLYFKREAYDAYLRMLADANSQGINFLICSTYRSYWTQDSIYFNYVYSYGSEYTNTISAYPGRSEHHTGWAVDVTSKSMGYDLLESFINYPEGQWINSHCHEYGFIVRYPKDKTHITGYSYEPWHLRYVGVDVATEIMSRGITLEEYLGVA